MAIDMFETRTLLAAVEQMKPARTFLRDTFFNPSNAVVSMTENVDIDIVKGARRLAPFVHPRIGSKTVDSLGYTTKTFKPPLVAPDYGFTGEDLQVRLPGENIYSSASPDERLTRLVGQKLAEFDELITRREEWMCAKALFTGKVPVIGEGVNYEIDFNFTNSTSISVAKSKWNYTASDYTGDPIKDMKTWKRALVKACGYAPTIAVMSPDAADAFMAHPVVETYFNKLRLKFGEIAPRETLPGVNFVCFLPELGITVYSYEEWFVDPADNTEKVLVPEKTVMLASPNAGFKMMYGAVIDVEMGTFAMPRVPKSWTVPKPSARYLQLSSRPLPVPVLVDSYLVATVM